MIIATAGHVDHGKTTLVKALTGVDTDRLKEEKLRGMSIEAGFAYADLGNGFPIGFVDVPGHERFVRNMLAGVASVDFALLVVAVDDGPMPQTMEHLAILDLLDIRHGAVALTKIDRVSSSRLAEAQAEVISALAPTALRDVPLFAVSPHNGAGMDALRRHLAQMATRLPRRVARGNFRLAVDRCFSLAGAGLVVTGTVSSGTARAGSQLLVSPAGIAVRVRSIHMHNQPADIAQAGWRCALNVTGSELKRVSIERGDWLVESPAHAPTDRCDVRISVLASQAKPLAHWAPVHLHAGAVAVTARVALLEGRAIEPGQSALAQLVLDRPIGMLRGDRFILRDPSARQTVAGGVALDPFGPARGRSRPERLAYLAAMEKRTPEEALECLLDHADDGVQIDRLFRAWNLTPDEADAVLQRFPLVRFHHAGETRCMPVARWQRLRDCLEGGLREWHEEQPDGLGPTEAMLGARLGMRTASPAWRAALKALCEEGVMMREGLCLRLPAHRPRLSDCDTRLLERVSMALRDAGLRPPAAGELAKALDMDLSLLMEFLERTSHLGHLVRVARNRFFLPESMTHLTAIAAELSREAEQGVFDAATFRNRSGIGRNVTIEVLEFMDRVHTTRYAGGKRRFVS